MTSKPLISLTENQKSGSHLTKDKLYDLRRHEARLWKWPELKGRGIQQPVNKAYLLMLKWNHIWSVCVCAAASAEVKQRQALKQGFMLLQSINEALTLNSWCQAFLGTFDCLVQIQFYSQEENLKGLDIFGFIWFIYRLSDITLCFLGLNWIWIFLITQTLTSA